MVSINPQSIKTVITDINVLENIYYFGTYTKEQRMVRKIQKWYKSLPNLNDEYEGDWDKSFYTRMLFSEYSGTMLDDYPNMVINKCSYTRFEPYTGSKKSELRKWILNNMTCSDMCYFGF